MVDGDAPFDVRAWLAARPASAAAAGGALSPPARVGRGLSRRGALYAHEDFSQLRELRLPALPADLNAGIAGFNPKPDNNNYDARSGVEHVIAAVRAAGAALPAGGVLTYRNNLNKLIGTALDPEEGWEIEALLVAGGGGGCGEAEPTLVLEIVPRAEAAWERTAEARRFSAWGYQWEARCTGAAAADADAEYCCLVATTLTLDGGGGAGAGSTPLLIAAEMDVYDSELAGAAGAAGEPPPLSSLVELKTIRPPASQGARRTLHQRKMAKWYVQSSLGGVPRLLIGERDDAGVVHAMRWLETAALPRLASEGGARWNGPHALAFGADALAWMRARAADAPGGGAVRFAYNAARREISAAPAPGDLAARVAAALCAASAP
jgi:RAT1-interacting protein